jgi:antitoxin component YwqK of YwqJK toxin-antitoxin module
MIQYTMKYLFFLWFILCNLQEVFAQEDAQKILADTIPDLKVELEKTDKDTKKTDKQEVKGKKNVYYGIKTRKTFIPNGSYVEIFNHIKKPDQLPSVYIEEIAWYDPKKRRIQTTEPFKAKKGNAYLLHGPYRKERNNQIIEEGFYFLGTKHGRWERYGRDEMDRDFVLIEKTKYDKGFLKDSQREFYDVQRTKLKEVVPIKNGKKQGKYNTFHENGNMTTKGQYEFDEKIGLWTEYYDNGQRKREIQYPKSWKQAKEKPVVLREWDTKGKMKQVTKVNDGY